MPQVPQPYVNRFTFGDKISATVDNILARQQQNAQQEAQLQQQQGQFLQRMEADKNQFLQNLGLEQARLKAQQDNNLAEAKYRADNLAQQGKYQEGMLANSRGELSIAQQKASQDKTKEKIDNDTTLRALLHQQGTLDQILSDPTRENKITGELEPYPAELLDQLSKRYQDNAKKILNRTEYLKTGKILDITANQEGKSTVQQIVDTKGNKMSQPSDSIFSGIDMMPNPNSGTTKELPKIGEMFNGKKIVNRNPKTNELKLEDGSVVKY